MNKYLKRRTVREYIYYFNKFIYDKFNQETISIFLSKESNRNNVARSFLVNFKKFLIINRKEFDIDLDDYQDIIEVELPKLTGRATQKLINVLSHEQIFLIEKYLPTEKLKLQLLVTYYGALRLSELLKIKINSFNWETWKKNPEKMGECKVYGKGNKEGVCVLPSHLMKRISGFIRSNNFESIEDYLFIKISENSDQTKLENKGRLWQIKLKLAGVNSGITKVNPDGSIVEGTKVNPHKLRHSYATHLLKDRKVDTRYIQEALRHSSIQSTQIYTKVDKEDLKEILDEGSEIPPFEESELKTDLN